MATDHTVEAILLTLVGKYPKSLRWRPRVDNAFDARTVGLRDALVHVSEGRRCGMMLNVNPPRAAELEAAARS
ncbi:hypothetical protein QTI66_38935 [Variovorax sp. J22R133]|uniref:hypothetical protein n=1 Tax=Variovorax brevis TaxID=3053503 RepID=UPI0025757615|nr:hypothetical protein [Variovorax sp. J22R133]MDM0118052.1 hypothetical protein [Variovorax sp. J22R133]